MITIRCSADMVRALASPINDDLKQLLATRRDQLEEHCDDLGELAHFIVAEAGDTLPAIEGAAGVGLATNFVDGTLHGEPDFVDNFEFVQRHQGDWFEAVVILSDDGFGLVLLVPDQPSIDPALLSLVRDRD